MSTKRTKLLIAVWICFTAFAVSNSIVKQGRQNVALAAQVAVSNINVDDGRNDSKPNERYMFLPTPKPVVKKVKQETKSIVTKQIGRRVIKRKIVPAKKKVVTTLSRGENIKPQQPKSRGITMTASAYGSSAQNGGNGSGMTATGTTPSQGRTCAVDPRIIPLGSKIYIMCPSHPNINGEYTAEDTGGAIQGNRVDIYFANRQDMLDFGISTIIVNIMN